MASVLDSVRKGMAHDRTCPHRYAGANASNGSGPACACDKTVAPQPKPKQKRSVGDDWADGRF